MAKFPLGLGEDALVVLDTGAEFDENPAPPGKPVAGVAVVVRDELAAGRGAGVGVDDGIIETFKFVKLLLRERETAKKEKRKEITELNYK